MTALGEMAGSGADGLTWVKATDSAALPAGEMLAVSLNGLPLLLYRLSDGEVCCTSNICTHGDALLSGGWFEDDIIECPLHGGCFNVCTGKGQGAPIKEDIATYPVREQDGTILIALAGALS